MDDFYSASAGIVGNSLFALLAMNLGWRNDLLCIAGLGILCLIMLIGLKKVTPLKLYHFSLQQIITKQALFAGWHLGLLNSPVFILGSLFGLLQHF
ncbi:MAG: hypothetical protein H0U70_05465 [Tatlockia sp.]|nr:hypothetical protein [Tatlockia sp.]